MRDWCRGFSLVEIPEELFILRFMFRQKSFDPGKALDTEDRLIRLSCMKFLEALLLRIIRLPF